MSMRATDVAVAEALATVVREGGNDLAGEPRRVQGMMSDVLGSDARTRRAEVDAVVVAVEEGIPEDLLAGRIDGTAAVDRMRERGLDLDVSRFAVEVWQYALGQLEADAPPPSLTNTLERPATDPVLDSFDTVAPVPPAPTPDAGPQADVPYVPATEPRPSRRALVIGATSVVAALVVIALVATLVLRDDGAPVDTAAAKSGSVRTVDGPSVRFAAQSTPLGEVRRTWVADGSTLVSTLTITNDTGAAVAGRHIEVVPKSIAASASQITSEPAHVVLVEDPVIAWDVALEPDESVDLVSEIDVEARPDAEQLAAWKDDQHAAEVELAAERSSPPALAVSSPTPGQVMSTAEFDVTGTVEAGSAVKIGEGVVSVNPDGTWTHRVGGYSSGPQALKVVATDVYGTTSTVDVPFVVLVPGPAVVTPPAAATPSTPKTSTTPKVPKAVTPAPVTPAPVTPAPVTPAPAPPEVVNSAPVKKFDPTHTANHIQCTGLLDTWYVYVLQAFSDPDGDTLTVTNVSTSTGSAKAAAYNGQSTVHFVEPYQTFSGKAYVTFTVSDGRGGTANGLLTITVNPSPC